MDQHQKHRAIKGLLLSFTGFHLAYRSINKGVASDFGHAIFMGYKICFEIKKESVPLLYTPINTGFQRKDAEGSDKEHTHRILELIGL